ncbi:hypothetical protein AB4254_09130 [Vibrio breoganii]
MQEPVVREFIEIAYGSLQSSLEVSRQLESKLSDWRSALVEMRSEDVTSALDAVAELSVSLSEHESVIERAALFAGCQEGERYINYLCNFLGKDTVEGAKFAALAKDLKVSLTRCSEAMIAGTDLMDEVKKSIDSVQDSSSIDIRI